MSRTVGIVGAGIMGRMAALELVNRGWRVHLFDKDDRSGHASCTWSGAGMLAPSCELESAEGDVALLGIESLEKWKTWFPELSGPVYFEERGSLVVAHPGDHVELERLKRKVLAHGPESDVLREVTAQEIHDLEPSLPRTFQNGIYFAREAHLDNRQLLEVLGDTLTERGIVWHDGVEVSSIKPHELTAGGETATFDWVFDCRGLSARDDLPTLRGIRGELLYIEAPEVTLSRPIRLMHPRFPLYIVPRQHNRYLVGATAIESDDKSPISVRSTLELLSAAYTVHPAFAEGRLIETVTDCRPAFPNNRPRILHQDGLIRINGLYRHGFLVSPRLAEFAAGYVDSGTMVDGAESFMEMG